MTYQSSSSISDMPGGHGQSEGIRDYRNEASQMGRDVLERGRMGAREGRRMARDAQSSVSETVRHYPLATLMTTATVAFILGAMWQGGSRRRWSDGGWMNRSTIDSWLDSIQDYAQPKMRALSRESSRWR